MANKNVILRKQIGEVIYDLMVKTSAMMVYIDDSTTLSDKLTSMLEDITDSKTKLTTLIGEGPATSITSQIESAVTEAIDAIKNESDPNSLAGKIAALNVAVTAINNSDTGILATAKKYTDEKIGLSDTAYSTVKAYVDAVKSDIVSTVSGAFHFKGVVDYVSELDTNTAVEGDVYQVRYSGSTGTNPLNAEYAFDGEKFIELGSFVDLSGYLTADAVTSAIATAKTEAIDAAAADATSKVNTAKTEIVGIIDAYKATNDAAVAKKARIIVSTTEPEDLTESDVWAQVIE